MPIKSRWAIPIPSISLPTWLFTSHAAVLSKTPIMLDATRPETHSLSMHEYRLWSQRLAAGLIEVGLSPGDRVLLFSGNNLFFPIAFMGVVMAGGIFTSANPAYVPRELAHQLQDSGAKFMLAAGDILEVALQAAALTKMKKDQVFVFDKEILTSQGQNIEGVLHWSFLFASAMEGLKYNWEGIRTPGDANRIAALNYSSGTTGLPKGVEITHRNYIANASQIKYLSSFEPDVDTKGKLGRWLCFLPMYHAMGQVIYLVVAPLLETPVYIMQKFDFIQMLENLQKFRITDLILVPPIVVALAKSPATRHYDLSSVVRITSGAAPLGREISMELENIMKPRKVNVKQGWGMTETTVLALAWDPREESHSSAVGELNPNCEAMVMNDDGVQEVSQGQRGELWVRGPNIMKGYWRNKIATESTMTSDGWLKTGDICYVDIEGKFHIVDRKKELIKVKGYQVAPAELEALLLEHPDVVDAAVIGVTTGNNEELPKAYVVRKEGSEISGQAIAAFIEGKVSKIKRLSGGVAFLPTIPKNPSGKILRKVLREQAKAEIETSATQKSRL